jgi:hypothetical protein
MALTKITKSGITDSAVDNNKIEADAVDATKIADNAISEEHLDATVITGHTELSASAATDDVLLVYDTSAGVIKKIQASNVGVAAPVISSVSPTSALTGDGTGNHTFVITGTGFSVGSTAKLITDGGSDVAFDTVTRNSPTQITGVIAKSSLSNANEPYDVKVTNAENLTNTLENQINIDASPAFVTASGSLGTFTGGDSVSVSVNATDPESAGNVTFELQSGTLPAGLSLSNSGADGGTGIISGTATDPASDTTYNFVLRGVDAASNTSSRAFSITVNKPVVYESFTSSGTFSVPAGVSNLTEVLVVAGGGSGATTTIFAGGNGGGAGGGGAGGLIFMPDYPVTPGGTITVTVGSGGEHPNGENANGTPGQDSAFGSPGDPGFSPTSTVLTAKGGGGGGRGNCGGGQAGQSGGSGGGAGNASPPGGSATQPTQPGNSGAYGFGNPGGTGAKCSGPSYPENNGAGGGGGAGAAAADWFPLPAGTIPSWYGSPGGIGKAYTIADGTTPVYYAGGGGGGAGGCITAFGGLGGGGGSNPACNPGDGYTNQSPVACVGTPYPQPRSNAMDGDANKGGGGAGTGDNLGPLAPAAGDGGKGVVIIKY